MRSVGAGMLLLLDRGFYSFEMIERTWARGAHILVRVPASRVPFERLKLRQRLPDGSY